MWDLLRSLSFTAKMRLDQTLGLSLESDIQLYQVTEDYMYVNQTGSLLYVDEFWFASSSNYTGFLCEHAA